MFGWISCVSDPRARVTVPPFPASTRSSPRLGISMGCLPIRLIVPSPHVGEHFAADAFLGRVAVGHDAGRRGHDRDAETAHDPWQIAATLVDAAPRLGDALDPGDRARLARAVL